MTWPCQNTNELREFFDMKKKGVGSPAYKLGIHIKDYREQKKWSQATLANKIETDQKRISKIETGNVYRMGYLLQNITSAGCINGGID